MQIDTATPFGQRVSQRLTEDIVAWLVTVRPDGTPEPSPIWFYWDGKTFLIYSLRNTARERNLKQNPRVAIHFDSDRGGDVAVFTGTAEVDTSAPPCNEHPAYLEKYRAHIGRIGSTPEHFAQRYSLAIRVTPAKLRGH